MEFVSVKMVLLPPQQELVCRTVAPMKYFKELNVCAPMALSEIVLANASILVLRARSLWTINVSAIQDLSEWDLTVFQFPTAEQTKYYKITNVSVHRASNVQIQEIVFQLYAEKMKSFKIINAFVFQDIQETI